MKTKQDYRSTCNALIILHNKHGEQNELIKIVEKVLSVAKLLRLVSLPIYSTSFDKSFPLPHADICWRQIQLFRFEHTVDISFLYYLSHLSYFTCNSAKNS